MRLLAIAALALLASGCTSVLSPRIDDVTGTTLEQRCVDYRASLASLELVLATRELSEAERARYDVVGAFVNANCPVSVPALKPAE